MALSVLTAATGEVLTSSDEVLRQWLRLEPDETEQDELIDDLARTARQMVENFTRRRMMTQTLRLTLDRFCDRGIALPVAPIQSVSEVTYLDDAGTWQTLATSGYRLITSEVPNALHPAFGTIWPVPRAEAASVRIDLLVGYGGSLDVPPVFRQAIRRLVSHFYYHRDAMSDVIPASIREALLPTVFWV